MSRTRKQPVYKPYNKEDKEVRVRTNRKARHEAKVALDNEEYDAQILTYVPHTEGWGTW